MQGEKCCRKPQLTLCLLFPYFSEQISLDDIHLIGGPFLALKAVRDLNCLTTEFHSLAVFFRLWIYPYLLRASRATDRIEVAQGKCEKWGS